MIVAFISQPWNRMAPSAQASSLGVWSYQIARRLARRDRVVIYAARWRGQPLSERQEGIEYRRVSLQADRQLLRLLRRLPHTPGAPWFGSSLYYLAYIRQIARDLRRSPADVIHVHNLSQFVPVLRRLDPGSKIVLHMHCEWLTQLDRKRIEPRIRQSDLVLGCSDFIVGKVRRAFPGLAGRCRTLYNGADFDLPGHPEEPRPPRRDGAFRLLYIGRVSPEKGLHVLIDALPAVVARYPRIRLEIVGQFGSIPYEFLAGLDTDPQIADAIRSCRREPVVRYDAWLRGRVAALGLEGTVAFRGGLPHANAMRILREADLFLYPSVWNEPFGMPVVEAMAAQVPVIATRSGGIMELVEDGGTGCLVERGDPAALSAAILRLLDDEELRRSMGWAGHRQGAKRFTWERIAEQLLRAYAELLSS